MTLIQLLNCDQSNQDYHAHDLVYTWYYTGNGEWKTIDGILDMLSILVTASCTK